MTTISPEEVAATAFMARLGLSKQTAHEITQDMSNILTLLEKLNAINTENIKPMAHPLDIGQPLREDKVTEKTIDRDTLQALAYKAKDGFYNVLKVIEEESN